MNFTRKHYIKNNHKFRYAFFISVFIFMMNFEIAFASDFDRAWEAFMSEWRLILAGISGFGALTSLLVFIIHFIKLASLPSHPIQRQEIFDKMLISAITTALLGGISLVLVLYFGIFFEPN